MPTYLVEVIETVTTVRRVTIEAEDYDAAEEQAAEADWRDWPIVAQNCETEMLDLLEVP